MGDKSVDRADMQKATQQLQNPAKLKDVRRGIARVKTLIGQKAGQA